MRAILAAPMEGALGGRAAGGGALAAGRTMTEGAACVEGDGGAAIGARLPVQETARAAPHTIEVWMRMPAFYHTDSGPPAPVCDKPIRRF